MFVCALRTVDRRRRRTVRRRRVVTSAEHRGLYVCVCLACTQDRAEERFRDLRHGGLALRVLAVDYTSPPPARRPQRVQRRVHITAVPVVTLRFSGVYFSRYRPRDSALLTLRLSYI